MNTQLSGTSVSAPVPQIYEPLLDDKQAAEFLGGLHHKTIQRMARDGELPAFRIGKFWRFRASQINEWLLLQSTGRAARVQ